jgi:hypothetical protein
MIPFSFPSEIPMRFLQHSLLIVAALGAAGCATMEPPKPWERGDLAKASMQIDPDKLELKIQRHIYPGGQARPAATASAEAGVAATDRVPRRRKKRKSRTRSIAAAMREPECGKRIAAAPQSETKRPPPPAASALFAAALALPGMLPSIAAAQAAADHGTLELKYPDYRDQWGPAG